MELYKGDAMNRERLLLAVSCFLLASLFLWLACEIYQPQQANKNGSLPQSTTEVILNDSIPRPYPADNWWNTDISDAPVDSASDVFIDWIGATVSLHLDCGVWYGIPYCTVCAGQGLVDVDIYAYPDESDPGPYPIPEIATTDWRYVENGSDHHLIMYNVSTGYLYELFGAEWAGTEWRAKSGAIFDTKVNYRRPEGWTSADASGMAIMPGLVKWHETMGTAPIRHAHRFTVRATNGYCWPANHSAGITEGALPLGARLRLRHDFPIAGYSAPVQRLLQAFKTYGLILTDNGSDMYITGTQDERWGDMSMWIGALNDITAGDFEVIELGWTPPIGTGVQE